MAQVCAAEGCIHERTVLWEVGVESEEVELRAGDLVYPSHQRPACRTIPLCLSHANAVANGTPMQFKHNARRYTFDGQEVTECQ